MTHPTSLPAVELDAIGYSKRILALVDDYTDRPNKDTRAAIRAQLLSDFDGLLTAAQARAEAVEWISVDERLPEKNTEVLVAFKGIEIASTGQYTGSAHDKGGWCYPSENNGCGEDFSDPVVIAWQPLPAIDTAIGGKGA